MKYDPHGRQSVEVGTSGHGPELPAGADDGVDDSPAVNDGPSPPRSDDSGEFKEKDEQEKTDEPVQAGEVPAEGGECSEHAALTAKETEACAPADIAGSLEQLGEAVASIQKTLAGVTASIIDVLNVANGKVLGRIDALEQLVTSSQKSQEMLSGQIRWLNNKVEALPTSLADPRLRQVFMDLLQFNDLLENLVADSKRTSQERKEPRYEMILSRVRKILERSGVMLIPCDGKFNADLHEATDVETTKVADDRDTIKEIVRNGFHTEQELLRPASVVIRRYEAPRPEEQEPEEHGDAVDVEALPQGPADDAENGNHQDPRSNEETISEFQEEGDLVGAEALDGTDRADDDDRADTPQRE